MGSTDQPHVFINAESEKPDAAKWNDNFEFLNVVQQNLVRNSGFEASFIGGVPEFWTILGTGAVSAKDVVDPKDGVNSVQLTFGSAPAQLRQSSSEFLFYRGQTIRAWCFVRTNVASQARIAISDNVSTTVSSFHTGGNNYELLVVEHQVSAIAIELNIELRVEIGGDARFDVCAMIDATSLQGRLQHPADAAISNLPIGYMQGCQTQRDDADPATQVNILAGNCLSSDGSENILNDILLTADITTSGLAGLDTGVEAADTWYHIFLIKNPSTGLVQTLLSLLPTAPTLPAGFTKFRRVGSVRNNSGSDFIPFRSHGASDARRFQFLNDFTDNNILSNGLATVETAINLATRMPPTSLVGLINVLTEGANVRIRPNTEPTSVHPLIISTSDQSSFFIEMWVGSDQQLNYIFDAAPMNGLFIGVAGYVEEL